MISSSGPLRGRLWPHSFNGYPAAPLNVSTGFPSGGGNPTITYHLFDIDRALWVKGLELFWTRFSTPVASSLRVKVGFVQVDADLNATGTQLTSFSQEFALENLTVVATSLYASGASAMVSSLQFSTPVYLPQGYVRLALMRENNHSGTSYIAPTCRSVVLPIQTATAASPYSSGLAFPDPPTLSSVISDTWQCQLVCLVVDR